MAIRKYSQGNKIAKLGKFASGMDSLDSGGGEIYEYR